MKFNRTIQLLLGLVWLGMSTLALADMAPPVKVTLKGDPRGVAAGEVFEGTLQIQTESVAELTGFRFEGADWTVEAMNVVPNKIMGVGENLEIPFAVRPADKAGKLAFKFEFDGFTVTRTLDLSAEHAARMIDGLPTREVPATAVRKSDPNLQPATPLLKQSAARDTAGDDAEILPTSAQRTITISGRFIYDDRRWDVQGVDGLTVRVYDEDPISDDHLGTTITGPFGYFSIDVSTSSSGETNPDIFLTFDAANSVTQVQDATWEINYSWKTGTWDSFSGSELDVGWRAGANESEDAGLNILTNIVRTWRWLLTYESYDTPTVDVQWPDGSSGAWYNGYWEEIHISTEHEWNEDTMAHEYGHHWVNKYATAVDPEYCNGVCDGASCGHCMWCNETTHVAFSEGFPNWFADIVTRSYPHDYGIVAYGTRSQENLKTCWVDSLWHDPMLTEGFFGALLRDIEDSDPDDHDHYPGYGDVMSWGSNEIFDVIDGQHPTTPMAFLADFQATYAGSSEVLWETAKNCGYEIDSEKPGAPTNLLSTHAVGVSSADPTIEFGWYPAPDDASGIAGYGIYIMAGASMPGATMDIGDVNDYITDPLSPGTYYFNLRAVDRAGRWSDSYVTYGPVIIRAPEPSDLTYEVSGLWDYPVVPRNDATASLNDARVSALLEGNTSSTYANVYGTNQGEAATSAGFEARIYVDDVHSSSFSWAAISSGSGFFGTNRGPRTVAGGRHTFGARFDAVDVIAETDETNNVYAHQFIWTPLPLVVNTPTVRSAPPGKDAGWAGVVDGSAKWYNCDGLQPATSGWWNAIAVYAADNADDYDVRLHDSSTGSEDGFAANRAYSARPAGCLDAVLFNKNIVYDTAYNAGVLNGSQFTGDYVVEHITSQNLAFGDSLEISFSGNQYLQLVEFSVTAADTGYVSITVDVDPSQGPVIAQWRDQYFDVGPLSSANLEAVTDPETGRARLDFHVGETGYNGLALFRDPKDGGAATTVVVEISGTPPDLTSYDAPGWYAPLGLRPVYDATPTHVAAPDTLHGNLSATYLNMAVWNDSPTDSPEVLGRLYLDGVYTWWVSWPTVLGKDTTLFNDRFAKTVRGGRHVFDLRLDPLNAFEEIDESNNNYGLQYCWSPLEIVAGSSVQRSMPPPRTGGWETLSSGSSFWYNCDGLRIPAKTNWWQAVAVMPAAGTDVDIRLHPLLEGVDNGFGQNLAYSGWGPESSDFVVVNYTAAPAVGYDAGVLNISGNAAYTADHQGSVYAGLDPSGDTPGFDLPSGEILNLHDVYLTGTSFSAHLVSEGGGVDWGLSLMPAHTEFMSKSSAVAAAWREPAGGNESLVEVAIPEAGYYCLVVWKAKSADLAKNGSYHLYFGETPSGVAEQDTPSATALRDIYPNPFNPQTTIVFDLARSAQTEIVIYDLKGSRVTTLENGVLAAGRHDVVWRGTDSQGQRVASGVYMVRMQADSYTQMKKLMLVK